MRQSRLSLKNCFQLSKQTRPPLPASLPLALSRMNVVTVTFLSGLTMDELYEFHMLLSGSSKDPSSYALLQEAVQRAKFIHIKIGLIDYGAFSFSEGKTEEASEVVQDVSSESPPRTWRGS